MARSKTRRSAQEDKLEISAHLFDELTRLASRPRPVVKAQKTKRKVSKYNIFVQQEMKKMKEANPNMPVTERFSKAVSSWRACKESPDCMKALPKTLETRTRTRASTPPRRTTVKGRR